jgi:hypothetical protein
MRAVALLLVALVQIPAAVQAGVLAPQRSLRALGGRQLWLPICSRRGVNGSGAWFDNTNTAVMDQVACTSPSFGTVTALRLVYAAFDMPQQGEVDRPVTATGTASVSIPSANPISVVASTGVALGATQLTFSSTSLGANGISVGQAVSATGTYFAAGTYVSAVANSFVAGAGNTPVSTTVTLSAGVTAATPNGLPVNFLGAIVPAKFGGRRQFSIEPAHDVVRSDPIAVQLSPNTSFFVRTAASFSGTGMQLMDYPGAGSRLAGEFDSRSTSLNDQTLLPTTLSNTGGGFWCPVAVLGLVTVTPGKTIPGGVLILGDSIAAGTGDNADALGLQGYVQRSLENTVPFITAARGSTTALGLLAKGDGEYALSIDDGVTDILLEDGRNDISAFQTTDTSLEATIASIAARYGNSGRRVWCFTVPPTTQSNDGWTTIANQSWTLAAYNTTAAAAAGSTTLTLQAVFGLAAGQSISGTGIAAGTLVSAVNQAALTVTLNKALTAAAASGTRYSFGSNAFPTSEVYRQNYNAYLRSSFAALGCSGLVDDDSIMADPGGSMKWRVDLGSASADGVHPSAALHQAVVNAGLINPAMFPAQ